MSVATQARPVLYGREEIARDKLAEALAQIDRAFGRAPTDYSEIIARPVARGTFRATFVAFGGRD